MVHNVHKDIAPVDLTGEVGLAGHELGPVLTGALKGHNNLCAQCLQPITASHTVASAESHMWADEAMQDCAVHSVMPVVAYPAPYWQPYHAQAVAEGLMQYTPQLVAACMVQS